MAIAHAASGEVVDVRPLTPQLQRRLRTRLSKPMILK